MAITQTNEKRHFIIGQHADITFIDMELVGGVNSGGIDITNGARVTVTGAEIRKCMSARGGAINIENASLSLINSNINNNSADEGGGIFLGNGATAIFNDVYLSNNSANTGGGIGLAFASGKKELCIEGGGVTFSGNKADTAYWIEKDSKHEYLGKEAIDWKLLYIDEYESFVHALTKLPDGIFPFGYMFNNYDVAYIGSEYAKTPPIADRVVFSPRTDIPKKEYGGHANKKAQLLDLKGEKPNIEINNSTGRLWSLSVSYTIFRVNSNKDNHLRFALRDDTGDMNDSYDNTYTVFEPDNPQLVYQAENNSFLYNVHWGDEEKDMLKVLLPEYRHDLRNKQITSKLTWSLEVTPQS
jgi:hypothetical protein